MHALLFSLLLTASASDAPAVRPVYVLGTSINLRKAPAPDAELVGQLPIGTECQMMEKPAGDWSKVRCPGQAGEQEGYASTSLLGAERPSFDKLRQEAQNPKLKLKLEQREQSALRAAMLAPDDAEAQKAWTKLFFDRNFDYLARLKKPAEMKRTFTYPCRSQEQEKDCIRLASSFYLKDIKARAETKQKLFVVTIGSPEGLAVYRGRYQNDKKTRLLTGEVLERSRVAMNPVMEKALFTGQPKVDARSRDLTVGQFVMDEASQTILDTLPKKWGLMVTAGDGITEVQWNDCNHEPYAMKFFADIHGRWRMVLDRFGSSGGESGWISAVSTREGKLELTIESLDEEVTTHKTLDLPAPGKDIAHLQDVAYTYDFRRYPEKHFACPHDEGGP